MKHTLTTAYGEQVTITPGIITPDADRLFMEGQCVAMAVAIAQHHDWGLVVSRDACNRIRHAWADDGQGSYWDVRGDNDALGVEEDEAEYEGTLTRSPADAATDLLAEAEATMGPQEVLLAKSMLPALVGDFKGA